MLHQRLTRHMVALGVGALLAVTLTLWSAWKLYQGNTALREIAELRIVTQRLEIALHEQASSLLGHLQDADATRVEAIQVDARKAAQALQQLQGANRLLDAQLDARQAEGLNQLAWARFFALGSTFLLVLLLISAVVSMQAIRRRLSTGLEPLLLLAQRIGAGDLTSAVPAGPVHDEFGQVAQAFAQMRETMRDHLVSLQSLNAILDSLGGLRVEVGAGGVLRDMSSAAQHSLGYRAQGLEGAPVAQLLGQDIDFQTLRELIRQGLLQQQIWPWRRADGSSLPVRMSGVVVNEELLVLFGSPADALADGLLSKIGEGLILLDGQGTIRQANPAAAAMLDFDIAAHTNCSLAQVLARARCDRAIGADFAAELAHEPSGVALRLRRADRHATVVQVKACAIAGEAGQSELFALLLADVTELHRAQDEVRQLAYVDALTGLPNRARFAQRLDEAIKVARRRAENIALLFIDLDGFKDVNDSLGHDQGDVLLRHVGVCLQRVVREVDVVARLGGDEFCVLLSDVTDSAQAAHTAQRCLDVLGEPLPLGGTVVHPRGSVGIALYPRDAAHASGLLKAADTAMYAAKSRGKHGFAIYEAGMTDAVEQRLALGAALRCAIERDELMLHYQPKVSLVSGEMLGVEALVRWQRPGFGLVPPDQFIGVAEQIGLIGALGEWVLETACRQATAWRSEGVAKLDMAVNISPSHFESPGFVDMVGRVVSAHDMPTGALEIEVTESITRNPKRHISICQALRNIGVQVAIDDFGTGYSSLSVLKHMQVDTLKLDRQFIQDMTGDASSAVMIGTIIGLAAGLNFAVVAEGVETLEQVQVLSGLGCPMAQGYFFSRPVPAEQIPTLARTNFLARHAAAQPTQRVHAQLEAKEVTS